MQSGTVEIIIYWHYHNLLKVLKKISLASMSVKSVYFETMILNYIHGQVKHL